MAPLGVKAEGPVVLASMGIYLFHRPQLESALGMRWPFSAKTSSLAIWHLRVFMHSVHRLLGNVGTMHSFFDANLDCTTEAPKFDFYESDGRFIPTRAFCPIRKSSQRAAHACPAHEGCLIEQSVIEHAVIGIRSVIRRGSVLHDVIMMGQDYYESEQEQAVNAGLPARGVRADCHISRAILDKNTRIGNGVIITSHLGQPDEDGDCFYVIR